MAEVTLQSFGASRTVTGSRHFVRVDGRSLLLDCGLFQGPRRESFERNRNLPMRPDVVVLSHAHIDHSGAIPALVRGGFRGPIHATSPTRELCEAMLRDVARLSASDAEYLNKRRRRGEALVRPLFDEEDVVRAMGQFVEHRYDEEFEVFRGVEARFQDAGHIIGSAGVRLAIEDGPSIYFTGDIGRQMYPILKDPVPLPDADVVLSECTYGTRDHPPSELAGDALRVELERMLKTKGRVFIPAFSVGRTQNIVYAMAQLWRDGVLPPFPVYVDSPLADKATDVYRDHPECYDAETTRFLAEGGRPFHAPNVRYVENREESKALNGQKGPFVVIAGSGMAEGGRIVHHFLHGLADRDVTVIMVGWCAPGTLGRRLIDGENPVRVLGRWTDVRARVVRINAYSAHAGRSELLSFLAPAKDRGSQVHLVHGEEETALAFADALREEGFASVNVPETYAVYALRTREAAAARA